MPERLLLLSYAFPPLGAPEAVLAAKALRGLADLGIEVDVVAATVRAWQATDPSLVAYAEDAARQVMRVRQPIWLPLVQPVAAARSFPDAMRLLRRRTGRLVRTLDLDQYDAMLSWSQWHSVHLAALDAKRLAPGLRWTAHFSDPWVDNPLRPLPRPVRQLNLRMEAAVVGAADALEVTTELTADGLVERHGAAVGDKVHVVPHAYDAALYGHPHQGEKRPGLVVRHVGSFYGRRTPAPLLDGVARLLRRRPEALNRVQVELVGGLPNAMRDTDAMRSLPPSLVHVRPAVTYRESLALMQSADLLVVVDAPAERNVFLASKVVDYLGAGRPILGITPPGAAAELIQDLGGWTADPSRPDGVADALEAALAAVRSRDDGDPWGRDETRLAYGLPAVSRMRVAVVLGPGP